MTTPLPRHCLALILFLLLAGFGFGQPAPFISPEVAADGKVTFRVLAPKAQAVAVKGLRGRPPQLMTKDANGVWSATVGPLAPDLYSYAFDVDGASFTDPLNRRLKEWLVPQSLVEVPGPEPLLISRQDVPHGIVHRHLIPSGPRGGDVAFQVYTPPGYDPKAAYPVVYLLHGFGDDEAAWIGVGRAHFIADNLLAKKQIGPVVIVMTNGHPVPLVGPRRPDDYGQRNDAAMEQEMLTVVMPFVEANYPVRRDAAGRAIVGLSMGGGHSLGIGLSHPDKFGWIGGFSSAVPEEGRDARFATLLAAVEKKSGLPKLLWIGCGQEDFLLKRNEEFIGWLEKKQVPHEWHLTGGAHEWPVWRDYLAEFLQKIFR